MKTHIFLQDIFTTVFSFSFASFHLVSELHESLFNEALLFNSYEI